MPNTDSAQHMPWKSSRSGYIFQSKPVEIDAEISKVWALVKDTELSE